VEWPIFDGREEKALIDVLNSGKWGRTSGGPRLAEFETAFSERMRARYCVATSSGTTALLTALGALGVGPGDEVILPPYTFVATFNVITNSYALPIFVDSDAETFQLDPGKIAAAITPNTKLLLPVHIGGSPADLDAISAVAKPRQIPVIEDACQAHLAELHGRPVGTSGLGGCFSFQASKNLTSGEGGAVLTNDESFANLCYNFQTPGGAKSAASSGRGANYRLTEFQGALLLAQFSRLEEQAKTRDANAAYLTELLSKIHGITPARFVPGCTRSAWHLFMLRYDKRHFADLPRARFLDELAKAGIGASSGYSSLNTSDHVRALAANPHYERLYGKAAMSRWLEANRCPVNDRLCNEAVWFSQSKLLASRSEMERIAEVIAEIQQRAGTLARAG
jgi:dTDP-4-amino-4,6-dideoxygalactose transaminase